MKPFLLLIGILLLVSCGNTADTILDDRLNGEYEMTGLRGNKYSSEKIIFTFNSVGNVLSGDTGCNRFSANYHQEGKELVFTTPISTRKLCDGKMKIEQQILSSFEDVTRFIRKGEEFILLAGDNTALITLTKTNGSE